MSKIRLIMVKTVFLSIPFLYYFEYNKEWELIKMTHAVTSMNTRRTLARSLRNAMQKKPFSKITVTEIITDCGVNRKTFYYHFQDIYDLLRWMVQQDAVEVVKNFDLNSDISEAISFVMDYIDDNNHLVTCAYDSIGHDVVKSFFYSDFIALTEEYIGQMEKQFDKHLEDKYKAFLSKFYTEALSGMLMEWIKNREEINKELVISHITKTMTTSLTALIDAYSI